MHTLTHDPAATARPNTFQITERMGIFHVIAHVQVNDASPVVMCPFWCQLQDRDTVRRRDPDRGVAALLLSRIDDDSFALESAVLHHNLPRTSFLLRGWQPAAHV